MKPTTLFAALSCSALALGAHLPGAQEPAPPVKGGLQRVDPEEEDKDPGDLKGLFARDFDPERWRERLLLPDLERRERCFDALLQRARIDPVARAFLEELAAAPTGGELSWTARIALRELGRTSFPLQFPLQGFLGNDPFGSAQRMQEWMDQIFRHDGLGMALPHSPPRAPAAQGPRGSVRSLQVEQGEHGARVLITEIVDGEEKTRVYEGKSLDEILDPGVNPELEGELDGLSLRVQPGSPLDLRFELGDRTRELRRFPRVTPEGLRPVPQGRSRPIRTDRLGVIVQPVGAARARELGLEGKGLLVESSVPETYAHLLGVKAGDVLITLDGIELRTEADIERAMRARAADDELTLVWLDVLGQRQEKTWRPSPEPRKR